MAMADREAITILTGLKMMVGTEAKEACDVAISALQEREERSKGCKFCKDDFRFWKSELSGYFKETDIKFCPHCGRPLEE